ncbi:MAG TPA: LLM class flavin-dependent oxidoreductase [Acidimicrobiales bacterium]|jgi:alkanesulfonate monooxygenase SsuD/methylene tetrahydromethanopterin reductase-like flavin-dependent oxidoreductase (luciferase family)
MPLLVMRFDFRAPGFGATHAEQFPAALEMVKWADERGFDMAVVSEHHSAEDGYLPSPLVMCGAFAGATTTIGINVAALLVPLHDPVRLAEDMAVLDNLSGGRVSYVVGIGYRDVEFEMFGVDRKGRGQLVESHIGIMQQAWTGEPFAYNGTTVTVRPTPLTQPHPLLFYGGSTRVAAERAARLGLGFFPAIGDPELATIYTEACAAEGRDPGLVMLPNSGGGFMHVAEDPERDWAIIQRHAMHEAKMYASWQNGPQRSEVHIDTDDPAELRTSGQYLVVTPEECVDLANERGDLGTLLFHPLMGGLPVDMAWAGLELFADEVLPKIRSG